VVQRRTAQEQRRSPAHAGADRRRDRWAAYRWAALVLLARRRQRRVFALAPSAAPSKWSGRRDHVARGPECERARRPPSRLVERADDPGRHEALSGELGPDGVERDECASGSRSKRRSCRLRSTSDPRRQTRPGRRARRSPVGAETRGAPCVPSVTPKRVALRLERLDVKLIASRGISSRSPSVGRTQRAERTKPTLCCDPARRRRLRGSAGCQPVVRVD
jgi:hypothetical protein